MLLRKIVNLYCCPAVAGKLTELVPHHDMRLLRRTAFTTETYGDTKPEESVTTQLVDPAGAVNQIVPEAEFVMIANPV